MTILLHQGSGGSTLLKKKTLISRKTRTVLSMIRVRRPERSYNMGLKPIPSKRLAMLYSFTLDYHFLGSKKLFNVLLFHGQSLLSQIFHDCCEAEWQNLVYCIFY